VATTRDEALELARKVCEASGGRWGTPGVTEDAYAWHINTDVNVKGGGVGMITVSKRRKSVLSSIFYPK